MNRHERRAAQARNRNLPAAREDKRPLYFDISVGDSVECYYCLRAGLKMFYRYKEAFMNDPANSPDGTGDIHTICKGHLPDNAVIYNPPTNLCRNKAGDNTWQEDKPVEDIDDNFRQKR